MVITTLNKSRISVPRTNFGPTLLKIVTQAKFQRICKAANCPTYLLENPRFQIINSVGQLSPCPRVLKLSRTYRSLIGLSHKEIKTARPRSTYRVVPVTRRLVFYRHYESGRKGPKRGPNLLLRSWISCSIIINNRSSKEEIKIKIFSNGTKNRQN